MPNPHVDNKKGKKPWYIRKGKKTTGKKKEKSHFKGMSEETYCYVPCSYLESFYTKIQYFGPRSD